MIDQRASIETDIAAAHEADGCRGGRPARAAIARAGRRGRRILPLLAVLLVVAAPRLADARPLVNLRVDPARPVVGQVFRVVLAIETDEDAPRPEVPELPATDGASLTGPPTRGTSTRATIINGRRDASVTTTFTWDLVAEREGVIEIPAVTVALGADELRTRPRPVTVEAGPDEALFTARIVARRDEVVLGEPLPIRLVVDVVPYEQANVGYRMNARDAWGLIDWNRSSPGVFAEALEDLVRRRQVPPVKEVEREEDGVTAWRFTVNATLEPQRTGPLVLEPVALIMRYPRRIGIERDFFGDTTLRMTESLTLQALARAPEVVVNEPPAAGRPPWWTGAVGRFSIETRVDEPRAAVGDPMTLAITVIDRSPDGRADLDLLAAPRLDAVDALARDFRVAGGPLAGRIEGRAKVFETVIRPLRAGVEAVPAIPFSWWDPTAEEGAGAWGTDRSEPIPIEVESIGTLSLDEIEGGAVPGARGAQGDAPDVTTGAAARPADGIRPARGAAGDGDAGRPAPMPLPGWPVAALVVLVPPLAATALLAGALVRRTPLAEEAARARRRLRASAREAAGGAADAGEVAAIVRRVAAAAGGRDPDAASTREVLAGLPAALAAADASLPDDLRAFLERGDAARYGGDAAAAADDAIDAARGLVDRLVAAARRAAAAPDGELAP